MRDTDKQLLEELTKEPDLANHGEEIRQILGVTSEWQTPEGKSDQKVWDALQSQISESVDSPNRKPIWLGVAAAVVALVGALIFFNQSEIISHETVAGTFKTIELPDGSRVSLNAESQIKYSSDFKSRELELVGEAFFDVKSGSIFAVKSGNMTTQVLGTSFNIYARANEYRVECVSGKVKVSDGKKESFLLKNERVAASSGVLGEKSVIDELENAAWLNGEFIFTNASLKKVVEEFERQLNVQVSGEIEGLDEKRYSGRFERGDVEKAARQVFEPMGYTFSIQDKNVTIKTN